MLFDYLQNLVSKRIISRDRLEESLGQIPQDSLKLPFPNFYLVSSDDANEVWEIENPLCAYWKALLEIAPIVERKVNFEIAVERMRRIYGYD